MSGINVTQALAGVPQIYVIGNPSKTSGHLSERRPPARIPESVIASSSGYTAFANGTTNPIGSDGIPDGFPNP